MRCAQFNLVLMKVRQVDGTEKRVDGTTILSISGSHHLSILFPSAYNAQSNSIPSTAFICTVSNKFSVLFLCSHWVKLSFVTVLLGIFTFVLFHSLPFFFMGYFTPQPPSPSPGSLETRNHVSFLWAATFPSSFASLQRTSDSSMDLGVVGEPVTEMRRMGVAAAHEVKVIKFCIQLLRRTWCKV